MTPEPAAQVGHKRRGRREVDRHHGRTALDGEWVVHASGGTGANADLYVMKAAGSNNRPFRR
jgi:hypothetical protein